jgi:hypothetical protein
MCTERAAQLDVAFIHRNGSTNCCHGIGAPATGNSITPLEL